MRWSTCSYNREVEATSETKKMSLDQRWTAIPCLSHRLSALMRVFIYANIKGVISPTVPTVSDLQ